MELEGKIVFASGKRGDYDIWTLDLKSRELIQLTAGDFWNDCPRWSPDGRKILYISSRSGYQDIWLMDEDGANETQITKARKWHNTADWSPDGERIVFCANYDGNVNIYTMRLDGSDLRQITAHEGMDFIPQYSPDGEQIIFTSRRSGHDDIWTYNLRTEELKQLTDHEFRDFSPVYSPDGRKIAFVCAELDERGEENLELYLMEASGENLVKVTKTRGSERFLTWSPDGKYLMYTSSKKYSNAERLTVVDMDTFASRPLDFDRSRLEEEIEVETRGFLLFRFLPEPWRRRFYREDYFGTERYPDWKF